MGNKIWKILANSVEVMINIKLNKERQKSILLNQEQVFVQIAILILFVIQELEFILSQNTEDLIEIVYKLRNVGTVKHV